MLGNRPIRRASDGGRRNRQSSVWFRYKVCLSKRAFCDLRRLLAYASGVITNERSMMMMARGMNRAKLAIHFYVVYWIAFDCGTFFVSENIIFPIKYFFHSFRISIINVCLGTTEPRAAEGMIKREELPHCERECRRRKKLYRSRCSRRKLRYKWSTASSRSRAFVEDAQFIPSFDDAENFYHQFPS